jgi:ABC-type multidrug transport system ATPase subunit
VCDRVGVISGGTLIAEGTVEELRGRGSVSVRADPLASARERAERLLGSEHVSVVDGALRLDTDPGDAARINRELVLAGIAVSEVREVERSLEDVFLEMTGQGE